MHQDMERILLTEKEISRRVLQLGDEISRDFDGRDIVLVCILKGAVVFFSDLIRAIDLDVAIDFMSISSYGNSAKSSGVRLIKDLDKDVVDKHVIIVEDIIDTGLTLAYLRDNLISRGAKSLAICTLLDKYERRIAKIDVEYTGFAIPDEFVVGYGLDYAEHYRNLPYISVLKPEIYKNS